MLRAPGLLLLLPLLLWHLWEAPSGMVPAGLGRLGGLAPRAGSLSGGWVLEAAPRALPALVACAVAVAVVVCDKAPCDR